MGLDEKFVWTHICVLSDVFACSFRSACKSSQHHQTLQMNSSLACQNAFPLPSTPARVYRDLLCNGLIVRGIKYSMAPSPGVLWTVNFRFRQPRAQGHEPPALLKYSVASHIWNWLTCLNLPYLCSSLCDFYCGNHAKLSDWRPTCVRAIKRFPPPVLVHIFWTAIHAHFDEIYSVHREILLDTPACNMVISRKDVWRRVSPYSATGSDGAVIP